MQIVSSENVGRKSAASKGYGVSPGVHRQPRYDRYRPAGVSCRAQLPGARISPHFHDIDQFQIVVAGDCTMGKKDARSVTFQYADAYTPYGPIYGENEGFSFFTLRPIASGGFSRCRATSTTCRAGPATMCRTFRYVRPRLAAGEAVRENLMAPKTTASMRWASAWARMRNRAAFRRMQGDNTISFAKVRWKAQTAPCRAIR